MRCLGFWLRGFFWMGKWPYHSDGRCWNQGQRASACVILASIPLSIFGLGFIAGRFL